MSGRLSAAFRELDAFVARPSTSPIGDGHALCDAMQALAESLPADEHRPDPWGRLPWAVRSTWTDLLSLSHHRSIFGDELDRLERLVATATRLRESLAKCFARKVPMAGPRGGVTTSLARAAAKLTAKSRPTVAFSKARPPSEWRRAFAQKAGYVMAGRTWNEWRRGRLTRFIHPQSTVRSVRIRLDCYLLPDDYADHKKY